jgi:hypothetical protein
MEEGGLGEGPNTPSDNPMAILMQFEKGGHGTSLFL